jgi:DNA-binding CsgD family transcriptional regulator
VQRSIRLAASDLDAVLSAAQGFNDAVPAEGAALELLRSVSALVRCDVVFWNRTNRRPKMRPLVEIGYPRGVPAVPYEEWAAHIDEHPIMSGKHGLVTAVSDVYSPREFKRTWMYQNAFRPSVEHEIGVHLTAPPGELHVVCFSRGPGRDFDDRDRLVLRLLRPHLDAAFRRLAFPAPRLTPREAEVMRLVRDGLGNAQIARALGVSEATVGKHLEHVYTRTGAQSRVQALNLCAAALDVVQPPRERPSA